MIGALKGKSRQKKGYRMTSELLTVCAVGVAPAGLILTSHRALVQCLERLEDRLTAVENRLATVEREQAHPAGLLEGLREASSGHRAA